MNGLWRRRPWLLAGIALLALLAYGTALGGEFIYDDYHSVAANPAIGSLGNALRFFVDPDTFSALGNAMYRPVLVLSFACNRALGASALGFKAGNVLLHAANCWLLASLLLAHGCRRRAAVAAAALFAVHPLLAEAVNMISGRSELLLATGLLLGLRAQLAASAGRRVWPALGLALATAIACGSKETGVMVPVLAAVQDWLRGARGRSWRQRLLPLLPAVLVVVAYLLARKALLGTATATLAGRSGVDPRNGGDRDLVTQIATMGTLLPRALLQTVLPAGMSLEPPVLFQRHLLAPAVLAGWGGVLLLTGLGLRHGRRRPLRTFGVALAWATALPWVVLPLNVPLAEHRLYGPLLGLGAVLADVLAALPRGVRWRRAGRLRLVAAAAAVGGLFALAVVHTAAYGDERRLWRAALALEPTSYRARWGLGLAEQRHGDAVAAVRELHGAHALYPESQTILRNLVEAHFDLPADAAAPWTALVLAERLQSAAPKEPYPRIVLAQAMLGVARVQPDGDWCARAEAMALSCLEIAEPKGLVYRTAAAACRTAGEPARALQHLDTSVRRGLDHWTVLLDRSDVLRALGRTADAQRDVLRAQRQAPDEPQVQQALVRSFGLAAPR